MPQKENPMTEKQASQETRLEGQARLVSAARELLAAQKKSERAMDARHAHAPGTSRAKSTTLNANWARAAEHRDRCEVAALRVASEVLGPTDRERRYREALEYIANGCISPAIGFAQRVLAGDEPAEARRLESERYRRIG